MAACVIGVAMLLSFPAARTLQFAHHFGTTEIRQNIVRHTFVAGPVTDAVEAISRIDAQPAIPVRVTVENVAQSFFSLPMVSDVSTFRILRHLRLAPTRAGSSDPLI